MTRESEMLFHQHRKKQEEFLDAVEVYRQLNYNYWKSVRETFSFEQLKIEMYAVRGYNRAAKEIIENPTREGLLKILDKTDLESPNRATFFRKRVVYIPQGDPLEFVKEKEFEITAMVKELNAMEEKYNSMDHGLSLLSLTKFTENEKWFVNRYNRALEDSQTIEKLLIEYNSSLEIYTDLYEKLLKSLEDHSSAQNDREKKDAEADYDESYYYFEEIQFGPSLIRDLLVQAGEDESKLIILPEFPFTHPPWKREQLETRLRDAIDYLKSRVEDLETLQNNPFYQTRSVDDLRREYTTLNHQAKMNRYQKSRFLPKNASEKRLRAVAKEKYDEALKDKMIYVSSARRNVREAQEELDAFLRNSEPEREPDSKTRKIYAQICFRCKRDEVNFIGKEAYCSRACFNLHNLGVLKI
jgi:hypothetical protein